jgi:hypothetical protein
MSYTWKHNSRKRQAEGSIKAGGNGTAIKVIVGLDGYDYNYYSRHHKWSPTSGLNVHLAMNGPLQLTFDQLENFADELKALVSEAREQLKEME